MAIQVAVCGPSACDERVGAAAHEVGRLLATSGAVVVCGGYGGVMAAAAAGARSAGGTVVGILSGATADGANADLSVVVPTGLGEARNAVIVKSADAVVVVGGSWGTLSELALAMRRDVPVVSLYGWRITDDAGRPVPGVVSASAPTDAVETALRLATSSA